MFPAHRPHPDPDALAALARALSACADDTRSQGPWRSGAFDMLARSGALAGFIPADCGGTAAEEAAITTVLVAIAERCLTTALALTQWASACRIIAGGTDDVRRSLLPRLARGETHTTVGISQLSTSRRHLGAAVLTAARDGDGWRLSGLCPWVTGADSSDTIVTGALTAHDEQLFFVVPRAAPGLSIAPPLDLMALSGSRTSIVTFADVSPLHVIEPDPTGGIRTGGLATSALALGSTHAALALLDQEAEARPALAPIAAGLREEAVAIAARLHEPAGEQAARDRLRADANSLVVRGAQAALTAAKGAGFVVGHPAERLVRESLFFLVWSCPQTVSNAVLCELAGV